MKRKIITIDENKCTGCELCLPGCPEGALQMIEGKARLISDLFCDGLGAAWDIAPRGRSPSRSGRRHPTTNAR